MTAKCRFFNIACIMLLLTSCPSRSAGHNRNRMILQLPHQKIVRSVGQPCNARAPCINWACCRQLGHESSCYPRARRGNRCTIVHFNGTYRHHCPCAPGHGKCSFGSCRLENTNRRPYPQRL
uniref:Ixodegrin B n=1 Tax=Rhipicephalus zambeziensis TaxID=60191 RepID=A0A224YK55_9ACAR